MKPIQITDDKGNLLGANPLPDFPPGTVLLTHGLTGTAYQKFFSDDLFHSTATGKGYSEKALLASPSVYLVYVPEDD